jgi:hypothetical protein
MVVSATAGLRPRQPSESCLLEVRVERQGVAQPLGSHVLEAHAVYQAQPAPIFPEQPLETSPVQGLGDPGDVNQGEQRLHEISHWGEPEAMLEQRARLHDDIARRMQGPAGVQQIPERGGRLAVSRFGSHEQGIEP